MYLVLELLAIDGAATSTCAGWIASLKHEIWDYAMEDYVVVVSTLGKGREIFTRLGHDCQLNVSNEIERRKHTPLVRDHCKALPLWNPERVSRV